ncbi:thiosulfate oxidation carrier complex protein SoxZ [Aliihoeflea aestuarii]|uniref:thiosulfate oxidation carrier complex protein SoxZ n=1 Tax=Aliihoeflea aestuarii TaxID=453840 RepID=UPI002092A5A1|nr:thiosulfate oxidation carrier complex protein SoxZ [Aliihoeflea aestuarii]MCO6390982.1 thiosulfate oxidation carrier complex protein SoxZ [Aliihoeflea aestuarii]
MTRLTRRSVLALSGAGALALMLRPATAQAGAWQRLDAARELVGDATPTDGIELELPLVSENGAAVPLSFRVERALDDADPVETVHLFAPSNPDPLIAVFHFSPLAGRADVATRVRLNESQTVIAIARTASGEVMVGEREVRVTTTGCLMVDDTYESANVFQTRLRAPGSVSTGEPGKVLSMINHPMETGLRTNSSGETLPKRIIERVEATMGGEPVLTAELNRSVSANPYLRFFVAPTQSGTLELVWTEDTGETVEASAEISVG